MCIVAFFVSNSSAPTWLSGRVVIAQDVLFLRHRFHDVVWNFFIVRRFHIGGTIIKALTPLAELSGYVTTLRSLTQGRGTSYMESKTQIHSPNAGHRARFVEPWPARLINYRAGRQRRPPTPQPPRSPQGRQQTLVDTPQNQERLI
jgi:hypothetical protein